MEKSSYRFTGGPEALGDDAFYPVVFLYCLFQPWLCNSSIQSSPVHFNHGAEEIRVMPSKLLFL